MKNKPLFLFVFALLLAAPYTVQAQGNKLPQVGKAIVTPPAKVLAGAGSLPSFVPEKLLPALTQTRASAVVRHSLYPSRALTMIESEKAPKTFAPPTPVRVKEALNGKYIDGKERRRWIALREQLNYLSHSMPKPTPDKIPLYLRHSVPAQTLTYLTERYNTLVQEIEVAKANVLPHVVYSSLPGEGRTPNIHAVRMVTQDLTVILGGINILRGSLPDEPYLEQQRLYWGAIMEEFNPLLKGLINRPINSARKDMRTLNEKEFNLFNPDGTDYLLPKSESLIGDEDDLEELDSYAYVRARQNNPPITAENAKKEVERLLPNLPENMRIAFINDDLLPRINFKNWADKGYLGKNAVLEVYADGSQFMDRLRKGVHYDLVITDLLVPFGGISMMPELRSITQDLPVIASSKYDRGEEPEQSLFDVGMDGYLWYNSNLNDGSLGYVEYLRAMSNYFQYKTIHHWGR